MKEEPKGLTEKQTILTAQVLFFELNRRLNKFKKLDNLSRKGCIRAMQYALNSGITDLRIKLENDSEFELAMTIREMLDPRTIMQAELLTLAEQKTKGETNDEEK